MIKYNIAGLLSISIFLAGCGSLNEPVDRSGLSNQNQFFESIKQLCGTKFVGVMTYPEKGQDNFAGKQLVAHISSCDDKQIKIPFSVGEDKSRTWIVSKTVKGLQLKHDHRHSDGTPDEINMYGGSAINKGDSLSQSFAADEHTAAMIPAAATNVWTLEFNQQKNQMIYYLERNSAPRFKAILQKK